MLQPRATHSSSAEVRYHALLSVKNPRIRIVHTTDPAKAGGSMYLQQVDPWLGYKWGWSLTQREFRERDGVYGDAGLDLEYLKDSDEDGFPDVIDPAPFKRGYKDGEN